MPAPLLPPRVPGVGDAVPSGAPQGIDSGVVPRDMAALQSSEEPNLILQAMVANSEAEAQDAAKRVSDAGLNGYVEKGDGDTWVVRTRVARDKVTVDSTLAALRQLGYSAELVTRQ
jgi:general secretion pathway protein D